MIGFPEAGQLIQTGLQGTRQEGHISHEGHQIMTCMMEGLKQGLITSHILIKVNVS